MVGLPLIATALGKVLDFLFDGLIHLISKLPGSPFSYDEYVAALSDILPALNWFVPFYLFSEIFAVWEVMFMAMFTVFIIYRYVTRKGR